jgi:hypothetical protein
MKNISFDDLVIEQKGTWTQVCKECSENSNKLGFLEEIPINGLICGVKDCQNQALYYLYSGNCGNLSKKYSFQKKTLPLSL